MGRSLQRIRRVERAEVEWLCFAHAGGSASFYRAWAEHLPVDHALSAVELPGRGRRFGEPFPRSFDEAVADLAPELLPEVNPRVVLFGHSLGALFAYEIAKRAAKVGRSPRALIVSGHCAPHRFDRSRLALPEDELVAELRRWGGTPAELLDDPEMMDLMLPILRSDLALAQSYRDEPSAPLTCFMLAVGGVEDEDVSEEDLAAWRDRSAGGFAMRLFAGQHFFLLDDVGGVLRALVDAVSKVGGAPR